jgi:putative spermidine/putrescine transport system permease protein
MTVVETPADTVELTEPVIHDEDGPGMSWSGRIMLMVPTLVLAVFFLGPFALMLRTSFYRRIQGGFYEPAFVLESWSRLGSDFYIDRALFSLRICLFVAAVTVMFAFPFTWFLTRMKARYQVPLLIMILAALTLSEVIVAFAWDLILGRASGISNIMVWLGLMSEPQSYTPGYWAVCIGLAYIAFPYCVLTLYPALSRIDRELTEASETLGASPLRTFFNVVVPLSRTNLVAAFLMVFVFTLGSYIIGQVLGRPEHWTLSVFISDQATYNSNVPFAAAIAMFLTAVSLAIVGVTTWLGSRQGRARQKAVAV